MTDEQRREVEQIILKMEGWCYPQKAIPMYELVEQEKPNTVVEIGVFGGRSLIPQALALKRNGTGVIYGIDSWKVDDSLEGNNDPANDNWWKTVVPIETIHKLCMEEIWKHSLERQCVVIRAAAQDCHALFGIIDILHIDGNHSELASCRDVEIYAPKVKSGGYIWMDDSNWQTTQRAQEILRGMAEKVRDVTDGHNVCSLYRKK